MSKKKEYVPPPGIEQHMPIPKGKRKKKRTKAKNKPEAVEED